ncbi:MAG: magnesium chelatase subunit D [Betaproteobacteria bacterium]|jgi:magnesium chelatase subunit D|nr:magnesium chelatase subunit D [Betaproteobacteria bacterium]
MRDAWDLAQLALLLLQVDPHGLGGVWLKAGYSPARQTWLAQLHALGLPVMRMPHHIDQERMLGGIDLSVTLAKGRVVEQIGLLAQANKGMVVVPMSEKLSPQTLAMLLQAHDQGQVHALAIGATHASRFGLVALDESQEDEPGVASKLKERLALWIEMDTVDIAMSQEKIEALSAQELAEVRSVLVKIQATEAQMRALCEVAFALGIDSMRAPLLALRLACVHAAIHDREFLEEEDLRIAAQMVLSPRATRIPSNQDTESAQPSEPPPPPDASNTDQDAAHEDTPPPPTTEPASLEDTILAAALASLPPKLLDQLLLGASQSKSQSSSGNSGQAQMSRQRGRPLSPRLGRPTSGARLHLLATLRAAAPKQKLRTKHAGQKIAIRSEDFYIQRFAHKAASCIIVAMDASGSAALARLAEAKGAVEILLQQSYARRDSVCVIAFRGAQAQTLLPATRSLVRAKKALAGLPGGGGTPIALALKHATEQAQALQRQGITPLLVMLSDGKANVTIDGVGGRTQAQADALQCAKQWATHGFTSLWIDTALQPTGQAKELANVMQARYLPMPYVASQRLADAMQFAHRN